VNFRSGPTVACSVPITLVCPRPGMAASTSSLVSTSNVVSIGGVVSTSVAVNNFERGDQRLPEGWPTNTSVLIMFHFWSIAEPLKKRMARWTDIGAVKGPSRRRFWPIGARPGSCCAGLRRTASPWSVQSVSLAPAALREDV